MGWTALHRAHHRGEPVGRGFGVRIQKRKPLAMTDARAGIVAAREAEICILADDRRARWLFGDAAERVIG
jgi:hypothetical protein